MVVIDNLSKSDIQLLSLISSTYKLFSLAPVSVLEYPTYRNHKKEIAIEFTSTSSALFINSLGLLILLPLEVFYLYGKFIEDLEEESHLRHHFDIFFRINVIVIQVFLILIFSIKRREITAILNSVLSFESELVRNLRDLDQLHTGQHHQLAIFTAYFLISSVLLFNKLMVQDTLQAVANVLPKFAIRNLMIQYSILLIFIKKKYFSLNESLLVLTNRSGQMCYPFISIFDPPSEETVLDFVIFIRKSYSNLSEISNSIAQFYSIPMLVSLVYYFLGAVYVGYLFVSSIGDYLGDKTGGKIPDCIDHGLLFIMCIYPTIVLANSVTAVLEEVMYVKHTGISYEVSLFFQIFHSTKFYNPNQFQLEQFSMELFHQNVSFTAFEMVPLDNSRLTSVSVQYDAHLYNYPAPNR
ncbi:GSCOCT00010476001.3-RA-CDS [Cotesia congregata]|uniref:Gustatory receptor n=1 Tax=Cotesia congregata TaxID=51543 RepID=A0A8J2H8R7_COTCN|nr:GSCOCT00010476001.3-RA-CDS [Cotesia congregata]CAG5085332.1 gustatory receptor 50 [Cotesia congregata]